MVNPEGIVTTLLFILLASYDDPRHRVYVVELKATPKLVPFLPLMALVFASCSLAATASVVVSNCFADREFKNDVMPMAASRAIMAIDTIISAKVIPLTVPEIIFMRLIISQRHFQSCFFSGRVHGTIVSCQKN